MKKIKVFMMLVLAALGLFAVCNVALAALINPIPDFSDVTYDHPKYEPIYYLAGQGVINGYEDETFKPSNTINRAEFLKIVIEAAGYEAKGANCFKDVKDEWYAPYICAAANAGFVGGYKDGTFKPGQDVNFAEASKIVMNVLALEKAESEDSAWYSSYVSALDSLAAIPPTVSTFDAKLSRADMADMIWRIVTKNIYQLSNSYENLGDGKIADGELKSFSSCDGLKGYMEKSAEDNNYYYKTMTEDAAPTSGAAEGEAAPGGAEGAAEYSSTNIQVEGVDEADIVKNDGEYVYVVKGGTVRIIKAYPPTSMGEVERVTFDDEDFDPYEMYVDGDQLVVLGGSYGDITVFVEGGETTVPDYYNSMTQVYVFDISDRANAKVERKIAFDGSYSTSRKVDDMLYVVSSKYVYYYVNDLKEMDGEDLLPLYGDSAEDSVKVACGCGEVMYEPGSENDSYMVLAGIPLDDSTAEISTEVVLGWGGNVYASRDNLYVAEELYDSNWWSFDGSTEEETAVHKFRLGRENMAYIGSGNVPGRTLNQFSMDEHDGFLRVATTKGHSWSSDVPSTNGLYVLDGDLAVAGKVEGIASGEEIYSTRFVGDRAYMVTFKKVDPLFVIDVSDPRAPAILGELKIPGYSDYLHPYDENHIIGFGLDTETPTDEELAGRDIDFAWYQGIKIAMFDVTDVTSPKELHKVVIGDRGTYSELLYNHKALLFDKEKGIFAFPVTVAEVPQAVKDDPEASPSTYGDNVYQGAYVYDVSVADGFEFRGKITHFTDFAKDYLENWDYTKVIDRILYIGDYFYTVSQSLVRASEMTGDLKTVKDAVMEE